MDQQILSMSNKSNASSNTENLIKSKVQKEVENIFKMYKQKFGGITDENIFKCFLYDLGLTQTLNSESKSESNFVSLFYQIMNLLKFQESILFNILFELKFFRKKSNFDDVFETFIKNLNLEENLKEIIKPKLRDLIIIFSKNSKHFHNLKHPKKNLTKRNEKEQKLYIPKININSKELSAKREKYYQDKSENGNESESEKVLIGKSFNGDYQNENVKDIILYLNDNPYEINPMEKDKSRSAKRVSTLRYELFERQEKERKEKLEKMKEEIINKENEECIFTPKINEVGNNIIHRCDSHLKIRRNVSSNKLMTSEEQKKYNGCLSKNNSNFLKLNSNHEPPKCSKENDPYNIKNRKFPFKLLRNQEYPKLIIDISHNHVSSIKNSPKVNLNDNDLKNIPLQYSLLVFHYLQ